MTLLDAKNVSIHLSDRLIVKNVNLKVHKRELIGVIGPNGAGKSTLLKSLARLLSFQSGSIKFLGQSLKSIHQQELSQSLSYMAQGDIIHWPLKVEKLISLGRLPYVSAWQSPTQADLSAVREAMNAAEVSHLRGRTATKLSGGERRLVMLARALAVQPKVFLADEPVTGLDPSHQVQVMQLLRKMTEEDRGVVIVLHDLSLAARYCHKIYLMHEGKIVMSGNPREVLTPNNLKAVYGITAKYGYEEDDFYVIPWDRLERKIINTVM